MNGGTRGQDSLVSATAVFEEEEEERILGAAFVGSGLFFVLWKQAVATLRRHFCDDDCNCNVALDPAGCANFSSSLRASFHFRDRVQYCTVVNNNDTDRKLAHAAKGPYPYRRSSSLALLLNTQYAMACTVIRTRYLLLFFGVRVSEGGRSWSQAV